MKQKPGCFTVYRGITIFTYMKIIINYQQIPIKLTSRNGKLIPSNISQLKPPGLFRSWSRSRCSRCSRCLDQLCAAWGRCVFFFFWKKTRRCGKNRWKVGEGWRTRKMLRYMKKKNIYNNNEMMDDDDDDDDDDETCSRVVSKSSHFLILKSIIVCWHMSASSLGST